MKTQSKASILCNQLVIGDNKYNYKGGWVYFKNEQIFSQETIQGPDWQQVYSVISEDVENTLENILTLFYTKEKIEAQIKVTDKQLLMKVFFELVKKGTSILRKLEKTKETFLKVTDAYDLFKDVEKLPMNKVLKAIAEGTLAGMYIKNVSNAEVDGYAEGSLEYLPIIDFYNSHGFLTLLSIH